VPLTIRIYDHRRGGDLGWLRGLEEDFSIRFGILLPKDVVMAPNGAIPLRSFGKSDVKVSALGLGGHHLGAAKEEVAPAR
jgi:hypothetical protein